MVNAIFGRKLGMTQVFDENGIVIPVTVIEAQKQTIIQIKTKEIDGYEAAVIGFEELTQKRAEKLVNKAQLGTFKKTSQTPTRNLAEVEILNKEAKVGDKVDATVFNKGDKVDVSGVTRGRGFSGVIVRHNQARLGPMTHGSGPVHRHAGGYGKGITTVRLFKGTKMAGQYGHEKQTILNLEVVKIDEAKNVILVKGGVPGPKGSIVTIRKAVKA
ncbi:MAG: 50S ribosomal protein L3 [Firmicutes bacterium]|nr:50S ribosomal protein L3 [Bacillota bacterium]MCL2770827.1 50S ribosomal protein L3 [Bacillota bacterium]